MAIFISQFINGLNNVALLLLAALGMAIIFGIMKVVNLAHGDLIMLGAYITCFCTNILKVPFLICMLLSFIVTAFIGLIIEVFVIKRLYSRVIETMLATFAISVILQQIIRLIFGTNSPRMNIPVKGTLAMGSIIISNYNIFALCIAVLVLTGTGLIFYKTVMGKKIRAITQNRTMCECLGISSSRIDTITFAYGAGLAGLAGAILSPLKNISPEMGAGYLTDSFMTVVVGGVNSLLGTAVGSFLIGEPSVLLGGYMSEISAKIIVLLLVIIFIRFRPEGIFVKERR